MCYVEDVFHAPCGHWAEKPRLYHRCPAAPDQPIDQVHTIPSLTRLEQKAGMYRDHGDPTKPKPGIRMNTTCANPKTFGSTQDHENKCPRCRIDVDKIAASQQGMWFSFSQDRVTGELCFFDRNPESETSQRARSGVRRAGRVVRG